MSTMDSRGTDRTFLKTFIVRQRLKKKREMQNSQTLEERKRREERRRCEAKRNKESLAEVRADVERLDSRLQDLKQQKHVLFSQLKKVLNDDVIRRRRSDHVFQEAPPLAFAQFPPQFFAPPFKPQFKPTARKRTPPPPPPQPQQHYKSVPYTPAIGNLFYPAMTSSRKYFN